LRESAGPIPSFVTLRDLVVAAGQCSGEKARDGGNMEMEFDLGLDRGLWETLKALGAPDPNHRRLAPLALQELVASELAAMLDGRPIITQKGRKVVVRGSPWLWGESRGRRIKSSG
jgi:hypothetical protein